MQVFGTVALRWDVPVTLGKVPRFGYERALLYLAAELCWWTGQDPLDDPGPEELAECYAELNASLPTTGPEGLVGEVLAACVEHLRAAGRLQGAAPAIRLHRVRSACVDAALARLLSTSPRLVPAAPKVIDGLVLSSEIN
ncbi:hypothetical protein P3T35_006184 [Kitasatospora sp. GP30]|uniref:hypothetical protein n=1 Tax=Kitasatospora sp. GP30 TaxID=3035084 RepID=UPI000C709DCD|nr:hypothetical protein [Kitasatospora sp. GP30]MDH6144147.1 hypothetical protein [Kitasatospora sp. GP30]